MTESVTMQEWVWTEPKLQFKSEQNNHFCLVFDVKIQTHLICIWIEFLPMTVILRDN